MKTPMQEMLEYVQEEVQLFGSARQILISKIKELLEKEKEVIEKAWRVGCYTGYSNHKTYPSEDCKDYYNETFNNEEK